MFYKLYATRSDIVELIPFVHMLYAIEFPLKNLRCDHDGNVTTIPLTKGNV
jgi:hypothetical protein